jgi:prefoldin subunit 5
MAKKKQSIEDILDSLREQIDLLEDKINDIEQCECDSDDDIEEDEDEDEDE